MKTWNPIRLVRNLFSLATVNTEQDAFWRLQICPSA
jgi:hypothetical protein